MENNVFKVVLLQALPASGKSEVRNFMANIEPERLKKEFHCDVTRSVSKMTEIERRGGKRWDKPKKAGKSRDCRGGKF